MSRNTLSATLKKIIKKRSHTHKPCLKQYQIGSFTRSLRCHRRRLSDVTTGALASLLMGSTAFSAAAATPPLASSRPAILTPLPLSLAQAPAAPANPTLSADSTGENVSRLQATLKLLGFYQGAIDGIYTQATQDAVTQFQTAADIVADGVTGPSTWRKLLPTPDEVEGVTLSASSDEPANSAPAAPPLAAIPTVSATAIPAPPAPPAPIRAPTVEATVPIAPPNTGPPILRPGDEGPAVAQLQQELQALDYYRGNIDGGYGEQTQAAVMDFQREHQLEVDAIVGPATWDALSQALR